MVERWTPGQPNYADKHNRNLDIVDAIDSLRARVENLAEGEAINFFARLTSETSDGVYAWKPIIRNVANNGWGDAGNGFDSTTHGDARHCGDFLNLPCDATNDESSAKVRMWAVLNASNVLMFQFELLTEKDGERIVVNTGFGLQDGGAQAATADGLANDWNVETQDDPDDTEGAIISVIDSMGYTHAIYSPGGSTPGHIAVGWSDATVDSGGRWTKHEDGTVATLADVLPCPPISTNTANDIVGIYD